MSDPTADPITDLDSRYSEPGSVPVGWEWARQGLVDAEMYWLTTVHRTGRPHVTPLIGVWSAEALHFCTGPDERKAINLRGNPAVALTTGSNVYAEGFDIVLEGTAEPVHDEAVLRGLADAYVTKYGPQWRFEVAAGGFRGGGGPALVFRVAPVTVFGFTRGPFSQTRWRFGASPPGVAAGAATP
ncbi:pyridoxamine 5'-phosphate oxidase family protein [Rhodococcus sp. NPDC058505]|uniref:pyridoxamine 5'-phosphate oxidase family protein n=1 Tax=unclassified Rhodococcus (in: high G+C Gram-positive bacteria) TaxID=192944 RepID=UPI00365C9068